MIYWHPISDDINCLNSLDRDKHWRYDAWRDVVIYIYGVGVTSLGYFLPGYSYAVGTSPRLVAHFTSIGDKEGIRLSLNKDREIVIVNKNREILAAVGFFCEPCDAPGSFCDCRTLESDLYASK